MLQSRTEQAVELMTRFAQRTGVTAAGEQRRYLWTDAFAVCNLLGLARSLGDQQHEELALRLVERVHGVLGRHRPDDARTGWISGLAAKEGEAHPTSGGLRIGKPLPERAPHQPLDERLEWERDGQYFHYLTRWMHALDQTAIATDQPTFNVWARELAVAAHRAFTHRLHGGPRRMYWKMSIDLSRPLVASMGQHDPLDGFVTCVQLEATAARMRPPAPWPSLADETADFAEMIDPGALATTDPLGLGGLLVDAYRLERCLAGGASVPAGPVELLDAILAAAAAGLRRCIEGTDLRGPAHHRLAFRELGLAIGLAALGRLDRSLRRASMPPLGPRTREQVAALAKCVPIGAEIEAFWLRPAPRQMETWLAHQDINDVMLATSLAPDGFLGPEAAGS